MHRTVSALRKILALPVVGAARRAGVVPLLVVDAGRWNRLSGREEAWSELFMRLPEFRTVTYLRLRNAGRGAGVAARALAVLYRPQVALEIHCPDVGPGLYVEHGFATIVIAERIGTNFWVNQQVTIGYGSPSAARRIPVIGDDVYVRAGAKVFGGVTVGDNARIGANAVVSRDVAPGASMGAPLATDLRASSPVRGAIAPPLPNQETAHSAE
jgi:serine O-acetyltransferase